MKPDPTLYIGPNGAICCAEHKGSEGWRRAPAAAVRELRRSCLTMGLVALAEPLCECCRAIGRHAGILTREDA